MSEKQSSYYKEYCIKNKEKLDEMILCPDCGEEYKKRRKSLHIKTKKHMLKLLENENKDLNHLKENKDEILENAKKVMENEMKKILEKIK
jgi:hypothetical protein